MKEYITNFIYFINDIHYLKDLSKKEKHKFLIDTIKTKKNKFYLQLLFSIISSIFIYNILSLIFKFTIKTIIIYIIMIISIIYYYIYNKVLTEFFNSYNYFIKLCEAIIKYDNTIKNKIKIKRYMQNIEEQSNNNLINIISLINKTIKKDININLNDNYKNMDIIKIYNEYQNLKSSLFEFIFNEYEKEYMTKDIYILKYIYYINNYNNNINVIMKKLIKEFNMWMQKLDIPKIDYDSLLKQYEQYIYDNVIKKEEIKKNELKNKIYDLLISNYKLNENFIKLIKSIDTINDDEELNQMIEVIIEKKQLCISLLEQYKIKKKKEDNNNNNNINNMQNNNDIKMNNIININNSDNNCISLFDIQLNNININQDDNNQDIKNNKIINKNKAVGYYDIISEQEKIRDLKSSFIDELNDYCKKVKKLNQNKNDNINKEENEKEKENIENKNINKYDNQKNKNNTINDFIKEINEKNENKDNIDIPKTRLDFAKSLTLAFGKNKNFNLNFIGESDEN